MRRRRSEENLQGASAAACSDDTTFRTPTGTRRSAFLLGRTAREEVRQGRFIGRANGTISLTCQSSCGYDTGNSSATLFYLRQLALFVFLGGTDMRSLYGAPAFKGGLLIRLLPLIACLASGLFAQSSSITGNVADPTGSVIPGAAITVTNLETAAERATVADAQGRYTITQLPPGFYKV